MRAINVRGSFGRARGLELHKNKIDDFTSALVRDEISMVIVSESRLGPGLMWPAGQTRPSGSKGKHGFRDGAF